MLALRLLSQMGYRADATAGRTNAIQGDWAQCLEAGMVDDIPKLIHVDERVAVLDNMPR